MLGRALLAAALLALPFAGAAAHDYWLLPDPARPTVGAPVNFRLLVGEALKSDEERPFQVDRTPRFERIALASDGTVATEDLRPRCHADATPFCAGLAAVAGAQLLVLDRAPATIELAPEKFAAYLEEEGLVAILAERKRLGEEGKPGRERYRRCLKTMVRAGAAPAADPVFATVAGQELELIPASDPTLAAAPAELRVAVRFRGAPLAGLQVSALRRDGDELHSVSARSDAAGEVTLRLDAAATWMLAAVHMIRSDEPAVADWESFWTSFVFATPPADVVRDARVERWRADLKFLSTELVAKHKNLFHTLPREEWEARVAELDERIPDLADHEVAAEIARLVAGVGDAHTTIYAGSPPFVANGAPVELRWFPDGVRLIAAPSEFADAVGGRVVKVGTVAFDEAWRRASELISHENEAWLHEQVPSWLAMPPFLHALGLADDDVNAQYTVEIAGEGAGGRTLAVDVRAKASVKSFARAEPKELPLWLKRRRESYWFEFLPESRTLYLQYTRCADDPARPFAQLCEELFAVADREQPERFVIDLRHNGGGNSMVIAPLFAGLGTRRDLRKKGRLFVAIGPRTFSSGMMNAVQLRRGYGALLVGEPTGGKPNSYGEVKTLELPNSRIRVGYCTKYFEDSPTDVPSVEPDVAAPVTFEDWKAGRDPALAAILAGSVSSGR